MKEKALKPLILSALMFLYVVPAVSRDDNGSKYGMSDDSIDCGKYLSTYREFLKINLYIYAIEPWRQVFNDCPTISEQMYVDGVTMYRSLIEAASDGPVREGLIDTLMLIYDRRVEYYGGEGNIIGRKGIDLLRYRGTDAEGRPDIEAMEEGYGYLKKSIEMEKNESRDAVIVTFINSSISLNKTGKIDDNQTIEDYFVVTAVIDKLFDTSSRWSKAKANVDDMMIGSGLLTCEALNRYFVPQFEANKNDIKFLNEVIKFYTASGCDKSDLYVAASEQMYAIDPGPQSAHQLAILFISKGDLKKAASYLQMAVIGVNLDNDTRAEWFYELAIVSSANKDYCDAIKFAGEAINLKSNYGKAYMLLGDAFIASRDNLGDDFQQRTAFWAAADKYTKAASVDPSVAAEANQKLTDYAGQYPNNEDVFFLDLKDGDSYRVEGCINENTTVRSRK